MTDRKFVPFCWLLFLATFPGNATIGRHQEEIKRKVSNINTKKSNEKISELKGQLKSMEEKQDSPEVNILSCGNWRQISLEQHKMNCHSWNTLKRSSQEIWMRR